MRKLLPLFVWVILLLSGRPHIANSQSFYFNSGPIPMCDTSYFTMLVNGIGTLEPIGSGWGYSISELCINITSNHPQTLVITLTSPQGTNLLLSAYNGAGGSNYTNTCFGYGGPNITTGSAPFTGSFVPQGGNFSVFDWENADGTWTITIIDTACGGGGGGGGGGGPWVDGWFDGGAGAGSGGITFNPNIPPCWNWISNGQEYICPGETVDLTLFYNDPFLMYDFVFSGSTVANPNAVSVPGVYDIYAFDWNGCSYYAQFFLFSASQISLGPDQTISICSGTPVDLPALFPLAGIIQNWSLNGTPLTVPYVSAAVTPGVYQIIATSATECNDTALVTLTNSGSFSLGPDQNVSDCLATPFDLTNLYVTTGLTANWYLNGIPVVNPSAVSASGNYYLVTTDAGGCVDTAMVQLTITPNPALGPDQFVSACTGNIVDLTSLYSTGANTATWYFNSSVVSSPAAVTNGGVYTLIVTTPSGCADTAEVTLNVTAGPALGADQSASLCSNALLDISGYYSTTGYTASWTLNGAPVTNPSAINVAGTYVLIASAGSGCSDTALVIVSTLPTPSLGVNQSASLCSGTATNLNVLFSTTGLTNSWTLNGSPVANPANASAPGTYQLIATNGFGCSDTAQATLIVITGPSLGANQVQSICSYASVNLTSLFSTTGFTSSWSINGAPVINPASVNAAGTYTLIASLAGSCPDTAQVIVATLPTPSLGSNQSSSICSGTTINLNTLFTSTGFTTAWSLNGAPIGNAANITVAGTYQLIATGASGCSDTAFATVSVIQSPTLGANQTQSICTYSSVNLPSLYTTTGFTTSWTLNGSPVNNPGSVAAAGTYMLVASANGSCADSAFVTVTTLPTPSLGSNQASSACSGNAINLTTLFNTMGAAASWTLNGATVSTPSAVSAPGNYQLIATIGGCSDTAVANINILPLPVLGPDQNVSSCSGTPVNLTAFNNSAGNTNNWTLNSTTVATPGAVSIPGNYMITATNGSGCTATATVAVTFNALPSLGTDLVQEFCSGGTVDLTSLFSLTGLTTNWTVNGSVVTDPQDITVSGNYQLIATDVNGCSDTVFTTVTVNPAPDLGTDQSYTLCQWNTIDLSNLYATTGYATSYTFNGQNISQFSALHDSGTYTINVIDGNGCSDMAYVTVSNIECLCLADFDFTGRCIEDPVSFHLIADSVIVGAQWNFGSSGLPGQQELNPIVNFNTTNEIIVTLEANLSCGTVKVEKTLKLTECADSCHFYLPNAFTPNNDGHNDYFTWKGDCDPEEFYIEVYNRFGQVVFSSANPLMAWDGKHENSISPTGIYSYSMEYRLPYQDKKSVFGKLSVLR